MGRATETVAGLRRGAALREEAMVLRRIEDIITSINGQDCWELCEKKQERKKEKKEKLKQVNLKKAKKKKKKKNRAWK